MSELLRETISAAETVIAGGDNQLGDYLERLLSSPGGLRSSEDSERVYLAALLDFIGLHDESVRVLRDAPDAMARNMEGMLAAGHGQHQRARDILVQALDAATDSPPLRRKILANLAAVSLQAGSVGEAEAWTEAATAAGQIPDTAVDVLIATIRASIASRRGDLRGLRSAAASLEKASKSRLAELGTEHPQALSVVANMASTEIMVARAENSAVRVERAIDVLEVATLRLAAEFGADHPQAKAAAASLAMARTGPAELPLIHALDDRVSGSDIRYSIDADRDRALIAEMARLVDLDGDLTVEDAANRVLYLTNEEGVQGLEERLGRLRRRLTRHAVLNPQWLEANGLRVHFFLSNGRVGFLDQVVHAMETDRVGVSQYVLYGDWNSLIVLNGSDSEADTLYTNLRAGTDEFPVRFSSGEVLVEYRHLVKPVAPAPPEIDVDTINAIVANYDDPALAAARDELLASGHILGPAWISGGESPYPIIAYIGILLRGRMSIDPAELSSALLRNGVLSQTLVHLFRIDHGIPFHYLAKLACRNMMELDAATNALGFMKLGDVRFEGRTLVVAAGTDRFPVFRPANVSDLTVGPDFDGIMRTATVVYEGLGAEERRAFNTLDDSKKVAVVRAIAELQQRAAAGTWDEETDRRIRSALATFSRECVSSSDGEKFTGAVVEMTAAVEGLAKRLISRLAYAVYGRNPAQMQRELQLPTSKFRNLTLGKTAQALQVASSHPDFASYGDQLSDLWIERLARFAESRNMWAHDYIDLRGLELLDEAHRVLSDALSLAGWLSSSIEDVQQQSAEQQEESRGDPGELRLSDRAERGLSIFVSHASQDKRIASRVAMGLKAFEYDTWYDDWELLAGDSIIERIEAAISKTDVLLVLLSRSSVESKWIQRELSAGLARRLSGKGVMVIPVVVEDCEIPDMLAGTKYVDLRDDFERGFRELADALTARRARVMRSP